MKVFDMHCDLLSYLTGVEGANINKSEDIGCALPLLREGNVNFQVLAMYTATEKGSSCYTAKQSRCYNKLVHEDKIFKHVSKDNLPDINSDDIYVMPAVENASGFCEEDEHLDKGFEKLEKIIDVTGGILYIGMTHHLENRFGGGNNSKAGLKDDGKVLLDWLDGKKIAIDFSHTSDALAEGIFNYVDKKGYNINLIASHSNYRTIWHHARNLPDVFAKELINRGGLIGINFVRAFVDDINPETLLDHINYGIELHGEKSICMGADFYYTNDESSSSILRRPFFHKEHENAGRYPEILDRIADRFGEELTVKIAYKNVYNYLSKTIN